MFGSDLIKFIERYRAPTVWRIQHAQTKRIEQHRELHRTKGTDAFNFRPTPFKRTFPGRWMLIM